MIRMILFDLDETLYPRDVGILEQIRHLIVRYIRERFDLSAEEADALRRHYFHTYGTTMRGLQVNHQIDPDEFLHYVHNIPLHQYLQSNPGLDGVLMSIPHEKVIFTNASREHAERVLDLLGIRHHFTRIVDVRDVGYESKPQPAAYRRICQQLDIRPEECLLVEDNARNLHPAKALGMTTVLVRDGCHHSDDSVDYVIHRIEDIGNVLKRVDQDT
ncbi:MAG: pyrimidine 5'-nucleotidase [Anaerolineae bacterium]|jgi:putative hydrolase of the HAD superfamily